MEQQFMCVACHEALNVAQSQESFSERAYLRQLIAQGLEPQPDQDPVRRRLRPGGARLAAGQWLQPDDLHPPPGDRR